MGRRSTDDDLRNITDIIYPELMDAYKTNRLFDYSIKVIRLENQQFFTELHIHYLDDNKKEMTFAKKLNKSLNDLLTFYLNSNKSDESKIESLLYNIVNDFENNQIIIKLEKYNDM